MLRATEGYKLSEPFIAKVTDLLFIDDLKAFAQSQTKVNKVLMSSQDALQGPKIALSWSPMRLKLLHWAGDLNFTTCR